MLQAKKYLLRFIIASTSLPGLWSSRPLGHDDLIDAKNRSSSADGVLQTPRLADVQIQDVLLQGIAQSTLGLYVDAEVLLCGILMGFQQFLQNDSGSHAAVVRQSLGKAFEGRGELANRVLFQTR